jgi:eukaryotic-like serine/threonine-protein kinase
MPPPRELTDDYRLERILGSSRGGSVLRACHLGSGRTVAIKLINVPAPAAPSLGAAAVERFDAYVATLAGLRHPNLPAVLDWGLTSDGGAFLVMELLEGIGFDAATTAGGASSDRILPLLVQALDGLEELARHGLAHLNLCPENIFLAAAASGPQDRAPAGPPSSSRQPQAQVVKLLGLGTPLFYLGQPWPDAEGTRFRAPELALPAAATAALDWRADCFSLALTACNALGATVAIGEDTGIAARMQAAVPTLRTVQMPLALRFELANDEALRQILERCLRQAPGERPAHGAIREAFGLALGGIAPPASPVAELAATAPELPWGAVAPVQAPAASAATAGGLIAELTDFEPSLFGGAQAGGPGETGGLGPARDWRTALNASQPPAETPRWHSSQAFDGASEAAAPAGHEAATARDSLLDLFDVPATLPEIGEPAAGEGGGDDDETGGFGLDLPEGFELQPGAGDLPEAPPSTATEDAPRETPHPQAAAMAPPPAWTSHRAREIPVMAPPTAPVPAATSPGGPAPPAVAPATPASVPAAAAAAPAGLLPEVDELLRSLAPPPPPPSPPSVAPPIAPRTGAGTGPSAGPGAASAARPGSAVAPDSGWTRWLAAARGLPRPALLAAAGALLLAAAVAGFVLVGHGSRSAPPGTLQATAGGPSVPPEPPPRPGRSAAAKFFEATSWLILGKESDERVRQALRELSFGDQGELGPEGCKQLAAMQQALAVAQLETASQDLSAGLRNGDLGVLESVVEVASERDLPAGQLGELERARGAVKLYRLARSAAAAGDQAVVLERFHDLEGVSHTLRDPLDLRDRAAEALEAEALDLARDGRYDAALGRLGVVLRSWPERGATRDLVKAYEAAAIDERKQQEILDTVPSFASRRKPSEPLELLRAVQPTPHLEGRIAAARQQLEAQLAQLDAQPPQVTLRPGYPLDYARGNVVTLSFRVTDDYQVKSVKLFARPQSGRVRELPLQKSGPSYYDVEIPASLHQNGTLELWVVAADLSGHEGALGSPDNPLRVTRRKGFEQMLR